MRQWTDAATRFAPLPPAIGAGRLVLGRGGREPGVGVSQRRHGRGPVQPRLAAETTGY